MRLAIIHNEMAGQKRGRGLLGGVLSLLRERKVAFDVFQDVCHISDIENYDRLVVAGGDGSLRRVALFLFQKKSSRPLALIPTGTANVMAQEMGLKKEASFLAHYLLNGKSVPLTLAQAGDIPFLFIWSAGYDAAILHGVSSSCKEKFGKGSFVWQVIKSFFSPIRLPTCEVWVQGECHKAQWVIATRLDRYAGCFRLTLNQKLYDKSFTLLLFPEISRLNLGRIFWALIRGSLEQCKDVKIVKNVQEAYIYNSSIVESDGDVISSGLPTDVHLRLSERTILIHVPQAYSGCLF